MVMKDDDGNFDTSLLDYMQQGSIELMPQSLLQNDNPDLIDHEGKTLLHHAVELNNVAMTRHFINNNHDFEIVDNRGQSPLMLAVEKGSYNSAKLLVEAGANIYLCSDDAANILSYGAKFNSKYPASNEYHEFVKAIFQKLTKDCCNDEPLLLKRLRDFGCSLIQEISLGDASVTRLMLQNGYLVEERELQADETALHRAVYLGDFENVKVLLEFDASVSARDKYDFPPLYHLFDKPSDSGEDEQERVEIMKILIEHGALTSKAPYSFFANVQSPTRYICQHGGLRSLTALKQYDVDFNSYDVLRGLITNANDDVLKVLRGTSFNKNGLWNDKFYTNSQGLKPIISIAVSHGNLKKIEFLLEHGANPNECNFYSMNNRTPLLSAFQNLYTDTLENVVAVARLLLQYGADAQDVFIVEDNEEYTGFGLVRNAEVLKTLIAHLAIIESCGVTISDFIRRTIDSRDIYIEHFQVCKKQIEDMKKTTVNGSVTMFELLTESHLKITGYARDSDFAPKFEKAMKDKSYLDPYYSVSLQNRVGKAIQEAKLKEDAIVIMHKIFSCRFRNYNEIFCEILAYLTCDDLQSICYFKSLNLST